MSKNILVTGGCGFIGHHLVEHILKNTDWEVSIIDKLSYASEGYDRLRDIKCFDDKRVKVFSTDFSKPISIGLTKELGNIQYICHLGAESDVNKSIENPEPFVINNVLGTMYILDYARRLDGLEKMYFMSTDEVFGPAPTGVAYKEWDRYNSANPYSASKSGAEELCLAYANTYKLPVFVGHGMNVFGERQNVEKFIPQTIRRALLGEKVIVHSDKTKTIPGSRFYIHARNVSSAILFLLDKGQIRDKYNIVGEKEVSNLDLALFIASVVGKKLDYELVDFHSSRPGHDLRYALDGAKMKEMGWDIPMIFEQSLESTIRWTLANPKWIGLENI
jgi:dTDP-glucose 4,6-dehydratase